MQSGSGKKEKQLLLHRKGKNIYPRLSSSGSHKSIYTFTFAVRLNYGRHNRDKMSRRSTQVEVEVQPPAVQLQGDVVAPLALPVQQDALGLVALEAQRDHVLQRRHGLLVEPIQQGASAVKVRHVGL